MSTTTPRHIAEMTVAEIEAFERAHGIIQSWAVVQSRRATSPMRDAAAAARKAQREAAENGR